MRRRTVVVSAAVIAVVATGAPTFAIGEPEPIAQQGPQTTTPTNKPVSAVEARKKKTGCKHLYTRKRHRSYVFKVYRGSAPVKRRQHKKSYRLTRCQHTVRSSRMSRTTWRKERGARHRILARGNAGIGFLMARERGWGGQQFDCLNELWGNRESGWSTTAGSPGAAYGIPQSKPGSKMASAGPGWIYDARTQIKWGLDIYIPQRYGTPCGARAHSDATGWY